MGWAWWSRICTNETAISFPFAGSLNVSFLRDPDEKKAWKIVATQASLSWVEHDKLLVLLEWVFFFISVQLSIFSWGECKQEELEPIIYLEIKICHFQVAKSVREKKNETNVLFDELSPARFLVECLSGFSMKYQQLFNIFKIIT